MINTEYDWNFSAESETICQVSKTKKCSMPRGKMLGGSSSLNGMVVVRGSSDVYDKWALLGNTGWGYEDILPYFRKFEGNKNDSFVAYADGRYHNATGPVKIESGPIAPLTEAYISALKEAGVAFIDDINADKKQGHSVCQTYSGDGRRSSSAEAYLATAKNRPNLQVIKHAFVKKVLINNQNVSIGVEFEYKGEHTMRAYSTKEVIVSAGAIQSPPLLLRSGIGPKNYLESENIKCKVDLPVGENFIDHIIAYVPFTLNVSTTSLPPLAEFDSFYQYIVHKSGPLSSIPFFTALLDTSNVNGYFNTSGNGSANIQHFYTLFPRGSPRSSIEGGYFSLNSEVMNDQGAKAVMNSDVLIVSMFLVDPKSRGVVRLNTNSTEQDSKIYPNYLADTKDRDTLVTALERFVALMESPALRKIGAQFLRPNLTECDALEYRSEAYWRCFIKYVTTSGSHQHGSCKMGVDGKSVVDPQLKVYGVAGIRVADMAM